MVAGEALGLPPRAPTARRAEINAGIFAEAIFAKLEPLAEAALRVNVEEGYGEAVEPRQRDSEMRGEGGLARAALLLRNRDDLCHAAPYVAILLHCTMRSATEKGRERGGIGAATRREGLDQA
jgi:hypothetical protein